MLARWVGPEFLGIYSIANAIILILEVLSKMGIETGIMRFVSRLNPKEDHKKIQNLILSSFKMVFAFSIFVMALIIFLSEYIAFNLFKGDELLKKTLIVFSVAIAIGLGLAFLNHWLTHKIKNKNND